jgi:hypothetical protein
MKKLIIAAVVFFCVVSFNKVSAQAPETPGINLSSQPSWGPRGYDYVEYYYLPDIEIYYHVPERQFIYRSSGHWKFSTTLPAEHSNYDLFTAYKVVINEPKAYLHFNKHKVKYPVYKGRGGKPLLFRKTNEPRNFMPDEYRKSSKPGRYRY